jgi:uncharacterized membrane protein YkvA (DUF1232 family)
MSTELIDTFNEWINTLVDDAKVLRAGMEDAEAPRDARRLLVGGLSYLLRKIDIVPDYLSGVGVVDDAIVLRLAAKLALESGLGDMGAVAVNGLTALSKTTKPLEDYLGDLYGKLVEYVKALPDDEVRGRTADKVLDDPEVQKQFLRELTDELDAYAPKPITDPERAAREIKSFIKAKLDK